VGHAGCATAGGNDLPNMKPEIKAILTNKAVIAIDQDKLGRESTRAYADGEVEVWTRASRRRSDGDCGPQCWFRSRRKPSFPPEPRQASAWRAPTRAKDLWTGQEVTLTDNQPIELASHDILLVRIDAPEVGFEQQG